MTNGELPAEAAYDYDLGGIGRAVYDVATAWDARLAQVMRQGGEVIALRGAGSVGGIDPEAAEHVLEDRLIPGIEQTVRQRPVAVVYDGDPDDPQRPDIGYVAGRLLDRFGAQRDGHPVSFLTAQADDWYYPPLPGSNLVNHGWRPYETFVFKRGEYPGDHDRFTQSPYLAAYPHYRQIYVGAAGMLAANQMVDYCRNAPAEAPLRVTIIRAMINRALEDEIGEKLRKADSEAKRQKFAAQLEQRQQVYGKQWDNAGGVDPELLAGIGRRDDDSHELVVLWNDAESVDVVNCERIDLNTPEYDTAFERAGWFVKTTPIQARQIAAGQTETVIVKSGATRDTARGGDWVCTSAGRGEEYVVHQADFDDIYDLDQTTGLYTPKHDPRKLIKLDRDVIFTAPWGEPMAVRRGGYLMERHKPNGDIERYGIDQIDAEPDFVPVV